MGERVAVLPVSKPEPKKVSIERLERPWSASCDARAVVIVVIHLHCQPKPKILVSAEEIIRFIHRGKFHRLPSERRRDIVEAFDGRTEDDIKSVVNQLLEELVKVNVLEKKCSHGACAYRIMVAEVRTLYEVVTRIHQPTVRAKSRRKKRSVLILRYSDRVKNLDQLQ